MLEKKLQQASKNSAQQRKRMLSILAIALLSGIVLIGVLSFFPLKTPQPMPVEVTSVNNPPAIEKSGLREQFIQQLQTYEAGLEPAIAGANLKQWNSETDATLTAMKSAAIAAFAKADYTSATNKLTRLNAMAKQVFAERDARFSTAMAAAEQARSVDNYIKAKLHITKALLLKPDDQQAQETARKIELLPQMISLLKAANIARIENNPEKEYAAISKAIKLSPDRPELKQRSDALVETLKETRFSALISRGLSNVKRKKITAARNNYKQASSLYSGRSELAVLGAAIAKTSKALDLKHAIALAHKAIAQDDWRNAQSIYATASKRHPNDKTIQDGLQLANKIVSLQQSITDYIRRPERLASQNISAAARNALFQTTVFARNSASLSRDAGKLKALIVGMRVDIPVFVKSDNKTFILVRGIGKVGLTSGRTIKLKPGEYTFEGIRSGYKSKLVQVRLTIGETSYQVEVICDERI